jgi:1-aminocyclopropane-1-carboxylate deaminase/D-cysteine desulfhydrase-like pyridoxal-dependent ACC family enzyme
MLKNFAAILLVCVCGFTTVQATDVLIPVPVEQVEDQQKLAGCGCKDKRFETEEESVQTQKKLVESAELACQGQKSNEEEVHSYLACKKCNR